MKKKRHRLQRELKAVEKIYAGTLDWLEQGELYSWVEAGNSPFTNPEQIIHEDGTPFDFIEWHRSARWVTVTETPAVEVSDKERFDWSSDVCSSDLKDGARLPGRNQKVPPGCPEFPGM